MSYIEKEPLLDTIRQLKEDWGKTFTAEGIGFAIEKVEQAAEADVVEVVRCENCKECEVCPDTLLWCNQFERLVPPKGYCHCGERCENGKS